MTVELLQTLSLIAYIVAGVLFLVAVALFFLLEIPKLFGYLTGTTAKKAIETISQQSETADKKIYNPGTANMVNGKKRSTTAKLFPHKTDTVILNQPPSETVLLSADNNVSVANEPPNYAETTLLSREQIISDDISANYGEELSVDVEMGFLGSSEIIE